MGDGSHWKYAWIYRDYKDIIGIYIYTVIIYIGNIHEYTIINIIGLIGIYGEIIGISWEIKCKIPSGNHLRLAGKGVRGKIIYIRHGGIV